MNTLWSRSFWADALERAVKTAAQFLITAIGGEVFNVWQADWLDIAGVTLGGAVLSLATSIASGALPFGSEGTASLSTAVEPAAGKHAKPE